MLNGYLLRYFLINGFFGVCLYYGFIKGVEEARIISLLITWICIVSAICSFFIPTEELEKLSKDRYPLIIRIFDLGFDLAVIALFVISDYWLIAGLYVLQMVFLMNYYTRVEKVKTKVL